MGPLPRCYGHSFKSYKIKCDSFLKIFPNFDSFLHRYAPAAQSRNIFFSNKTYSDAKLNLESNGTSPRVLRPLLQKLQNKKLKDVTLVSIDPPIPP